ncbi:ArsR/SmtB family transcription factor [Halegenticoccus soli]|uniref:ArsR/SmtB family transcription factor n=1 Tax=Halegenticoccus soli TaxID=1985678 RepID=UPI000C6EC227|nr:helix-turn-helix transcriptional regulator [Halegenticoccus soli]
MGEFTADASADDDASARHAASAFRSLADENRIAILLALWEHETLPFAALQEKAGFEDSGRFNYHLGELLGRFVEKRDGTYRLRAAGAKAVDIVFDERFGESPSPVEASIDADCPVCDEGLSARYEDENVFVACPRCSTTVHMGYFPPRARIAHEPTDLFRAYARQLWRDFTLASEGVCPYCRGRTATRVEVDPDWYLSYPAVSRCGDCGVSIGTTIGLRLLADPAVVSFFHDHGVRLGERPFWEFDFCLDDGDVTVASDDPLRLRVPIRRGDETLLVTVDDSAAVVETARISPR